MLLKIVNVIFAVFALIAAIAIGADWYRGAQADGPVWALAIVGSMSLFFSAIERAFPFLKD